MSSYYTKCSLNRVSGAEAVVAAASPFIGQGESAMLIKPFVEHLTQAELHQVMLVFLCLVLPSPSSISQIPTLDN